MKVLRFDATYLYKVHALANVLDKLFDQTLREYGGLSLSQFMLLITVAQHETINQRKAAHFLGLSPAAIKRQADIAKRVHWLEAKQTVRGQALRLTPQGKNAIEAGLQALEQHVFQVFDDSEREATLIQHLDVLLNNTKGALKANGQSGDRKVNKRYERMIIMSAQIPKARKLYRGDVNAAVIAVQKITGIEIDPKWWAANVGNSGTSEQILDRFDAAYERDFAAKIAAKQSTNT